MSPEIAERLARVFPALIQKSAVAAVAPVAEAIGYRRKPPRLQPLQPLHIQCGEAGKTTREGVAAHVASPVAIEADAIEERAALAADSVPACYLDAWGRFQCQRPFSIDANAWREAIEDAGLFLDAWGVDAAKMRWTAGELFDVPSEGRLGGLVWQLKGKRVCSLGEDRARLIDGRTFQRQRGDCD